MNGRSTSLEFHKTVNFLAVDVVAITEAKAAPDTAYAAGGFVLMDLFNLGDEGFVDGSPILARKSFFRQGVWRPHREDENGAPRFFGR